MTGPHLTVVPPPEVAPSQPVDVHPIEVARRALREAAMAEHDRQWSLLMLQMASALPPRPRQGT